MHVYVRIVYQIVFVYSIRVAKKGNFSVSPLFGVPWIEQVWGFNVKYN